MLRRKTALIVGLFCIGGLMACTDQQSQSSPTAKKETLELKRLDNGNLEYCDEAGNCEELPYEGDCAVIEVDVDMATGQTCQRCILDDGTTREEGCGDVAVGCVVVTLPDPDCVVCAYVNGDVIFSSCTVPEPQCQTDLDCLTSDANFGRCIDGQCVYEPYCLSDQDCPTGFFCRADSSGQAGMCVPFEEECSSDRPCPPGLVCEMICYDDCMDGNCDPQNDMPPCHGVCVPEQPEGCQSDEECPQGMECVSECWCGSIDDSGDARPDEYCECEGVCLPRQTEPECLEDADCPNDMMCLLACWDCHPEDPDCMGGCEGICVPREQQPCEGLSEDECIFHPECEPIYAPMPCDCPECEPGTECRCDCGGDPDFNGYVGCEQIQNPDPCHNLDERQCIEMPECEPIYQGGGCACEPCDPDHNGECPPCDCQDDFWNEYAGCVLRGPQGCEDLSIDQCESDPDCMLMEVPLPCLCEQCDDPSGENCFCDCPVSLMCVPRQHPGPCEELDERMCINDPECSPIYDYIDNCECESGASDCPPCMGEQIYLGCEPNHNPNWCHNDADCPQGFFCALMDCTPEGDCGQGGICMPIEPRPECRSDQDCAAGSTCNLCPPDPTCPECDVCGPAICEPLTCATNADCPRGSHCEGSSICPDGTNCFWPGEPGICVPDSNPNECYSDADCEQGFHCEGANTCPDGAQCLWIGEPGVCVPNQHPQECAFLPEELCREMNSCEPVYGGSCPECDDVVYLGCREQYQSCIQVLAYAAQPETGQCYQFPTPCDVPAGWESCDQICTDPDANGECTP